MARILPQQTISNILQTNKPDDIYNALKIELDLELASSDLGLSHLNWIRTRVSSLSPRVSSLGLSTYTVLGLRLELELPSSHKICVLDLELAPLHRTMVSSLT